MAAKYEIVVFGKNGRALGNIRPFCSNLKWSKELNEAESLSFDIDLNELESLLDKNGFANDPYGLLNTGSHDIKIKRNGEYIFGTNVIRLTYKTNDPSVTMTVDCTGYLNYLKNRYFTGRFDQVYQEDILYRVLDDLASKTGGDYGFTRGEVYQGGQIKRDRSYERKEVKSLFQQLSNVINGPDFSFTHDKQLNVYSVKGYNRPDVYLKYPGNIKSFDFSRGVENVANYVIGLGSGNGEDVVIATSESRESELALYRREKIVTYNSVTEQSTLQQHADAILHYTKDIIELPKVTVQDGVLDLNRIDVGDTINLQMTSNYSLNHINGKYRIQRINVSVDDNDSEEVSLEFDDIDIDSIISQQEEDSANQKERIAYR